MEGKGEGRKRGGGLKNKKKDKVKSKVAQHISAKGRLEDQIEATLEMDPIPERIGISRFAKQRRLKMIRRQKVKITAENEGRRAKSSSAKVAIAVCLAVVVACFSHRLE